MRNHPSVCHDSVVNSKMSANTSVLDASLNKVSCLHFPRSDHCVTASFQGDDKESGDDSSSSDEDHFSDSDDDERASAPL